MIGYWIGLCGMWVFADGVASLWTYLPTKESWLRNHSFRIIRMMVGIILMILGATIERR